MFSHLMIVPTLNCPASCSYCFGPHEGSPIMSQEIIEYIVQWQKKLRITTPLEITFHGGEPLLVGNSFFSQALPRLTNGLSPRTVRFSLQSNLWLLNDELCDTLHRHNVSLGTSLDGPKQINDAQRGNGSYNKTMAGIRRALTHGINTACICTFTNSSVNMHKDIFQFFLNEDLNFSVHGSIPSIHFRESDKWILPSQDYGKLLVSLFEIYLQNLDRIRINTFDSLARSIPAGRGSICTFTDCIGDYLAVDPFGDIYPCQRFVGVPEYKLANVAALPALSDLQNTPVWRKFGERQERITGECGQCDFFNICLGGCPYNNFTSLHSGSGGSDRDPYCEAYKRIFEYISNRALEEFFSPENIDDIVQHNDMEQSLLRKGKIASLLKHGVSHPYEKSRHSFTLLAAVALASTNSPHQATERLSQLGLVRNFAKTEILLKHLHTRLNSPNHALNKLYLHVTFACNLQCTHCYVTAGKPRKGFMTTENVIRSVEEAAGLGFHVAVITGGEPLLHPQIFEILDSLRSVRQNVKPMMTVLRTNLAIPIDDNLVQGLGCSTDKVVVSVDGNAVTHDARRGAGSYDMTLKNLKRFVGADRTTEISLAATLPLALVNSDPGNAVRALSRELGLRYPSFRPLLPLGRAVNLESEIIPETLWKYMHPREMEEFGFSSTASCGIGQNLYVEPDGSAFPCYACCGESWNLGNIHHDSGLTGVINSEKFCDLSNHTVNTNEKCRRCSLRYLCGGACRAWSWKSERHQIDLDAAPVHCDPLNKRALSLFEGALHQLDVSPSDWEMIFNK